jgi:hypothetical protein
MTVTFESLKSAFSAAEDQLDRHWSGCIDVAESLRLDLASVLGLDALKDIKFVRHSDIETNRTTGSSELVDQFSDPDDVADLSATEQFRVGICFGVPYRNEPNPAWYLMIPIKVSKSGGVFVLSSEVLPKEEFPIGLPPKFEMRKFSEAIISRLIEQRKGSYDRFLSGNNSREKEMGFHVSIHKNRN